MSFLGCGVENAVEGAELKAGGDLWGFEEVELLDLVLNLLHTKPFNQ